ncbi:universal stress protein [Nocardioides sp. SYSU DS0651]|uniref:universal stress protein n=1 Tax=Nocardioides sp. SYSU DS0651 TaxID=3415955 RepID=UPI003F4BDEB8
MQHTIGTASIVVAVDGSPQSQHAVRWAAHQADLEHRCLVVVGYAEDDGHLPAVLADATALAASGRDALEIQALAAGADPRRLLVDLSERASLVVLGSRGGGGLRSMYLGSVASVVCAQAACPVMLCRAPRAAPDRGAVLVGTDHGPEARPVLEVAFDQAALRGGSLTVAHRLWEAAAARAGMGDPSTAETDAGTREKQRLLLSDVVAGLAEAYPEVSVVLRDAADLAAAVAAGRTDQWDLLVAPRHAVGAPDSLASGAFATSVLEHGPTSVVLVPEAPPAFAT